MRLKALKDVLVKLGGTPSGEKTCGAVIEKIADKAGGGGGGGACRVTITGDSSGTITADKTFAELKTAFEAGQILECYNKVDDRRVMLQLATTGLTGSEISKFVFKGENDWDSSHGGTVTQWTHYEAAIDATGVSSYIEAYFG